MASSAIQATGTVEFEDGLWLGNHIKAQDGLQKVRTVPGVQPADWGADWIPICLGLRGCLVLSQVACLIPGSRGLRIDPA